MQHNTVSAVIGITFDTPREIAARKGKGRRLSKKNKENIKIHHRKGAFGGGGEGGDGGTAWHRFKLLAAAHRAQRHLLSTVGIATFTHLLGNPGLPSGSLQMWGGVASLRSADSLTFPPHPCDWEGWQCIGRAGLSLLRWGFGKGGEVDGGGRGGGWRRQARQS